MKENIGSFEIKSGRMKISDPCYDLDTHMGAVIPALNGRWNAYIEHSQSGFGGNRPGKIMVRHESYNYVAENQFTLANFEVGVDSGQAGFWDASYDTSQRSVDDSEVEEDWTENSKALYWQICNLTGGTEAGVLSFGVFSSSGDGDGGYPCYIAKDKDGFLIAAYIDFYPDFEYDETNYGEDEYDTHNFEEYVGDPD